METRVYPSPNYDLEGMVVYRVVDFRGSYRLVYYYTIC